MNPEQRRLLRWYPAGWVERYGVEMLAMIDDSCGGRPVPGRLRRQLLRFGLEERLRRRGLIGGDRPDSQRARAGASLVLCGWAVLVVSGSMFAKVTEHWSSAVPAGRRGSADAAFSVVYGSAALGGLAVVAGAAAGLVALHRAWRRGRAPRVGRAGFLALAASATWAAATVALASWAHGLSPAQRNGGSGLYLAAFLGWGLLFVAVLGTWTAVALRLERQLDLGRLELRTVWTAGVVAAIATVSLVAAILAWWVSVARDAPWVLHGATAGAAVSGFAWNLAISALVGLVAVTLAGAGLERLYSARRIWRS
ncbi:MAG: hypothetical protein KGQ66_17235 [Acidobacteriota bacterium]|nr:hypothetical protein [Acidobacteriota bacterium]